jgi:hypothetical protein
LLRHQQGQAPLQSSAVNRGSPLLRDGVNAHAIGGGNDEFEQAVQLLGGGQARHEKGFEVAGGLRQSSVANHFMRHINCRKDLFLRRYAPAL